MHDAAGNGTDPLSNRRRVRGRGHAKDREHDERNERTIPQRGSLERDEHNSGKARGTATNLSPPYDTVEG